MNLLDIIKQDDEHEKLFSKIRTIDWYDGNVIAVCLLSRFNEWYLASLVWYDIYRSERIFILLNISEKEAQEILSVVDDNHFDEAKQRVDNIFKMYSSDAYLMKASDLDAFVYEIRELPASGLKFYSGIEEIANHDIETKEKWLKYFVD